MAITAELKKIGLSDKQAKVYWAILNLGTCTILEIARQCGLKRPTVYNIISELAPLGLISKVPLDKKIYFKAENPLQLINLLKKKEGALNQIIPLLQTAFTKTLDKPSVKVLEGEDAMLTVRDDWFTAKEIRFFGSIKLLQSVFPEHMEKVMKWIKKNKIITKDLLANSPEDLAYAQKTANDHYQVRISPPDLPFKIDCAIYNNKLTIFSMMESLFVVVIEDKNIVESFRHLHELAWRSAASPPIT